ncbi:MAG: TIGR02147 family protein, partial [Bdellovibrionales bacterium]|nr:TIGR02147 family protein [Bdellovibrionales bacterium]
MERQRRNPRMTLGSFSRFIGMTPSRLHDVLSGRNGMSLTVAEKVADRLGFDKERKIFFCYLVESEHGRSQLQRQMAKLRLEQYQLRKQYQKLNLDVFDVVSKWHHFAILELTYLESFQSQSDWIAQKLGISINECELALDRLQRLRLLKWENEKWIATNDYTLVGDDIPSTSIKKYHLDLIEKSQMALFDQSVEEREFTSLTLAISKNQIGEAKKRIRQFQKEFCASMENSKNKNTVYTMTLGFFQLDKESPS